MARIFISYSRADRQFIDQFVPLIRRVYGNDSVWFDDDIHGGVDWWQMILDEIAACDIFVYLISNESLESPYCLAELQEALRLKKQILPVIVRRLKQEYPGNIDDGLATILRRTQYVDMSGGFRDPTTIATLYAALTHLLSAIPPHPAKPITPAPTPEPPVPDKKKLDPTIRAAYIGGAFVSIAAIIAGILGLWQGIFANTNLPNSSPTNAVAQINIEPPTLSGFQQLQTTEAELTQSAGTRAALELTLTEQFISDSNATATAQMFAVTETAAYATLLALSATPTPRPTDVNPPTIMPTDAPDLVSTTGAVQTPFPTPGIREVRLVRIISNRNANVRSGSGENFSVISTAAPNSTYEILEERDGWYRISADGWVSSQIARVEQSTEVDWTPVERVFDGVPMVLVPAGCFDMGDNGEGGHQCFASPFWIGQTEVTNAQYAAFVAAGGYEQQRYWTDAGWNWKMANGVMAPEDYNNFTHANQPRIGVSWYEAVAYTHWLTERLRASGTIGQDEEIRLPTEAEWEYAARGPANLTYPWGNDWDVMRLNAAGSADGYESITAPVGSYPQGASWVGALDMIGNVWEWTLSEYGDYPHVSADGRKDISGDALRVLRGGSWYNDHNFARAADRNLSNPYNRDFSFGFRLCVAGG